MKKIKYCTIDTETIGGFKPSSIYNIGCVIHDGEGHIYATTSILIMEHYNKIKKDSYAKKNFYKYDYRLKKGIMTAVATETEAINIIKNLCHFYGVKYIMAYNSEFDFTKTSCKELLNDFQFIDIWLMALQTVTHLKKYYQYCKNNNFCTDSGKSCKTSAEVVYSYITDNPDYKEEHTALNDALIEKDIFVYCRRMHKRYNKNTHMKQAKGEECNKYIPKW